MTLEGNDPMAATLAFVDTETTGLDADRHEIWEVGLIVNGEERLWHLPVDLGRAEPIALKIGGFHDRYGLEVEAGHCISSLTAFAQDFAEWTRGCHLVGAVISFDEERLRKLLKANGACPEWHYHLIDVEALAAGALAEAARNEKGELARLVMEQATPPWNSDELSNAYGVDPEHFDRHTAMGDARWAKAIYEAVMGLDQ